MATATRLAGTDPNAQDKGMYPYGPYGSYPGDTAAQGTAAMGVVSHYGGPNGGLPSSDQVATQSKEVRLGFVRKVRVQRTARDTSPVRIL